MSSIMFDGQGRPVSDSPSFPLQGNLARHQGRDSAGNAVPVDPNVNMGVRATAHGGTSSVVIGGNKEAWAQVQQHNVERFRSEDISNYETGTLATAKRSGMSVPGSQLRPDDFVTINGTETSARNAATLGYLRTLPGGGYENGPRGQGPTMAPAGNATQPTPAETQAAKEAEAKATEAAREAAAKEEAEINRHPHAAIEEAHASFARDVPTQDAISLLVKAHRGQQPTEADINRIAEAMNVSPNVAADRLRAMNTGIEGQFSALARAHGVNPDSAADWIRTRRSSDALTAVRDHVLGRNLRAWEPLIAAYKAAGGQ